MSKAGQLLLNLIQKHINIMKWTVLPMDVKLCLAQSCGEAGAIGAALAGKSNVQSCK